jgi:hypothetical protein
MKPFAISSFVALAALSLYAGDPQTATNAAPAAHAATLLSAPRTSGIGDSPLVHAAKATNRLNKKPRQVITNETLVHAGGHFTTTTAEAQTQLPASHASGAPTMNDLANEQRRARDETAAAAAQARRLAAQKREAAALAVARAEGTAEGLYADPPALENNSTITVAKPVSPDTMTQQQKTVSPEAMTQQQKPPL